MKTVGDSWRQSGRTIRQVDTRGKSKCPGTRGQLAFKIKQKVSRQKQGRTHNNDRKPCSTQMTRLSSLHRIHSFSKEVFLLTGHSTMRSSGTHTTSSLSSILSWWCTWLGRFQASEFWIYLFVLFTFRRFYTWHFSVDVPAFWLFSRGVLKYQTNIEAHPPGCLTANQSNMDPQAKEMEKADNEERRCTEEAHFQGHYPQVCLLSFSLHLTFCLNCGCCLYIGI